MESAFELSEWKKTITETIDMYKRMLINPIWDDSYFKEDTETKQQYVNRLKECIVKCNKELKEIENE
jgi:hypothetical protein